MKAALNPFAPGSGLRPPALVGREKQMGAMDTLIERVQNGLPARGLVLFGLRGVGKTVLLNELRNKAEDADWFTVSLEARAGAAGPASVRKILAREIATQARQLDPSGAAGKATKKALASITAFNAKFGPGGVELGVERAQGRADSGSIEIDLPEVIQDLAEALESVGRVFGLFIDELQDLDEELLSALLVAQHQAGQREWPFFIIGAGLPGLPTRLTDAHSYAERLFEYHRIDRVPAPKDRDALVAPVQQANVTYAPAALDALLAAAGGYPYFLQEYGSAAWEVSAGPVVTSADADAAVDLGLARLDEGFFLTRWQRATPGERLFLVAMAADGEGPSSTSQVAERLGKKLSGVGPARAKLISKGLIHAPEHGQVAYTVPGMADYVHRHREDALSVE